MTTDEQNELYRMEIWFSRYTHLQAKAQEAGILEALTAAAEQAALQGTAAPVEAAPAPPADPIMDLIMRGA